MKKSITFLITIIALFLQCGSVSAVETTEELPQGILDAFWTEIATAMEGEYVLVGEQEIGYIKILEESENKISFLILTSVNRKRVFDSAYESLYMKGIFDDLGIEGSYVKDMSKEELIEYLQSIGYIEDTERLAGFIIGMAGFYQPYCEQVISGGWYEFYVEAEYTDEEYIISEIYFYQDIDPYLGTQYIPIEEVLTSAEYKQGRERFLELFPDLKKEETITQPESDEAEEITSVTPTEDVQSDVFAESTELEKTTENGNQEIWIFSIVIVAVIIAGGGICMITLHHRKKQK